MDNGIKISKHFETDPPFQIQVNGVENEDLLAPCLPPQPVPGMWLDFENNWWQFGYTLYQEILH